jgi:tetratricopeptide (TPR) repeat protein
MRGTTAFNMGRKEEARVAFEHVLPFFRRSGHRYREAVVLSNLGSVAYTQGRLREAARRAEEATEIARTLGEQEGATVSLLVLSDVEIMVGRWDSAHEHLRQALDLTRSTGSSGLEASVLGRLTELALEQGDVQHAVELARRSVTAAAQATSPMERGYAQVVLGYALLADGDLAGAEKAFRAASPEFESVQRDELAREAAVGLAAVALARGDATTAAELAGPMADHVDMDGVKDLQRPSVALRNAWRALDQAGDPRADRMLADIRTYLLAQAALIGDAEMAEGYLAKTAEAELLAEAARRLDG